MAAAQTRDTVTRQDTGQKPRTPDPAREASATSWEPP
jgi:hypothetical protein